MPNHVLHNVKLLAKNLQVLRDYLGKPIVINSAYRSEQHNKNVGGVYDSTHLIGIAVDITVKGVTSTELYNEILKLINQGKIKQGGLGLYDSFVHYDIRGKAVRWNKQTIITDIKTSLNKVGSKKKSALPSFVCPCCGTLFVKKS